MGVYSAFPSNKNYNMEESEGRIKLKSIIENCCTMVSVILEKGHKNCEAGSRC
jgi:hypothetical protein